MRDREIVAAIVAGDPAGLAAAYDSYAAALHAYCRSLLAEPADAADAVQDTFVIAAAKLGGLRDPDRLRPWLYAVARNECYRKLRARASTAGLEEAGEMTDTSADVGTGAERDDLRDLIRAAIAGLNPGEREIIELNLRHDLDGADLAEALGVSPNQAHALASRARGQLERSLGALLVARTGREYCEELAAILAGWDGQLSVLLRKRVNRHIERCEVCGERKRRELSPAALLSALPIVALPPGLRDDALWLVEDVSAEAVRYRDWVARRAEPFGPSGFPVAISPAGRGRAQTRMVVFAAAAVLLVLAGGGVAAAAMLRHNTTPVNTAAAHGAATTAPASTSAATSGSPSKSAAVRRKSHAASTQTSSPTATVTPTTTPSPTPDPTPDPTPTVTHSPKPKPTHTKTKSPSPSPSVTPPGTLSAAPTLLTLPLPNGGITATFTLTAVGGPVASFSITDPAGLSVTPSSGGPLKAEQSITITVTVTGTPVFESALTVSPGGATVTVKYLPSG